MRRAESWQRKILNLALRQDGLGEGNIQVNRAGIFACGCGDEVFKNGWELAGIGGTRKVGLGSDEGTENSRLVDRLVGTGATEFGGAVGCDENQRDAGMEGFHAGGQEVCHGGAAGGDADCGATCGHGPTERGEGHSSLVVVNRGLDPLLRDGGYECRSAGTGAEKKTTGSELLETAHNGTAPRAVGATGSHGARR